MKNKLTPAEKDKRKKELIEEIHWYSKRRFKKWKIEELEDQLKFEISLKN